MHNLTWALKQLKKNCVMPTVIFRQNNPEAFHKDTD